MKTTRCFSHVVVFALICVALLLRCSSPTTVDDTVTLTVTPSSGAPGTALTVSGLNGLHTNTDTLTATIGGQAAPVIINDSGQVFVSIPLFLDDSGIVVVPT